MRNTESQSFENTKANIQNEKPEKIKQVNQQILTIIRFISALAAATAFLGCATQKSVTSIQEECSKTEAKKDYPEYSGSNDITENCKLSQASHELIKIAYEKEGDDVLPCVEHLFRNKNLNLGLLAEFAKEPTTDNCDILSNPKMDQTVYRAMEDKITHKIYTDSLRKAFNSKKFDSDEFAYGLNSLHGNEEDMKLIAEIFNNPKYDPQIFSALGRLRRLHGINFYTGKKLAYKKVAILREHGHKMFTPLGKRRTHFTHLYTGKKLATGEPQVLFDFESTLDLIRLKKKTRKPNNNNTLRSMLALSKLIEESPRPSVSSLAREAVLHHQDKDDDTDILRALQPIAKSDKFEEIKKIVANNIHNKEFIIALSYAVQNPNFEISQIPKIKNAANKVGEEINILGAYLEHQDLQKIDSALAIIKRYSKHKKAKDILSAITTYFQNSHFKAKEVKRVAKIASIEFNKDLNNILLSPKTNEKVLKLAERLLKNRIKDEKKRKREKDYKKIEGEWEWRTFNKLNRIVQQDIFEPWMLDHTLAKPGRERAIAYLETVLNKEEFKNIDSLEEAQTLLNHLDIKSKDPVILLNFAYAIESFGSPKTTRLYEEFGIRYFSRYKKSILKKQLEEKSPNKIPVLGAFTTVDWNGAFATIDSIDAFNDDPDFEITIIETDSEKDTFQKLSFMSQGIAVIGGHGSKTSIELSGKSTETSSIETSDRKDFQKIKEPPSIIILDACSTGKGKRSIAAILSKTLSTVVYAPQEPTSRSKINIQDGKVISVEYTTEKVSKFVNGINQIGQE